MPQNPVKPLPGHTPQATDEPEAGGFLQRWSQRKANAATPDERPAAPENTADQQLTPDSEITANPEAEEAPPPVTEADLENLTYESDYTKFMGDHVPEAIRRRALRQLWRSDPILANLDGLCDYDDDFTDAALAVKVLQTAHKVGQGYLTDEEVAANRARGNPPEATEQDEIVEDDGEDMEDFDDDGDIGEADIATASPTDNVPDATPDEPAPEPLTASVGVKTPSQTETS